MKEYLDVQKEAFGHLDHNNDGALTIEDIRRFGRIAPGQPWGEQQETDGAYRDRPNGQASKDRESDRPSSPRAEPDLSISESDATSSTARTGDWRSPGPGERRGGAGMGGGLMDGGSGMAGPGVRGGMMGEGGMGSGFGMSRAGMGVETRWFHIADQNADGQVTLNEFLETQKAIFKRLDANDDGALTLDEFRRPAVMGPNPDLRPGGPEDPGAFMEQMESGAIQSLVERLVTRRDHNGDGALSREEFSADRKALFKTLDNDNDGAVTTAELLDAIRNSPRAKRLLAGGAMDDGPGPGDGFGQQRPGMGMGQGIGMGMGMGQGRRSERNAESPRERDPEDADEKYRQLRRRRID